MNLSKSSDKNVIRSTFQVAAVHKPLMSVGQTCDRGYKVVFDSDRAIVIKSGTNQKAGTFERRNGLYVGEFEASPCTVSAPFPGQG